VLIRMMTLASFPAFVIALAQLQPSLNPRAKARLAKTMGTLAQHSGVLLVDGSNVRAATGFRYTAHEMSDCLDAWAEYSGFAGRLAVCWDHGEAVSFQLSHSSALLSGCTQTADDIIVKACGFLAGSCDIVVVTSDQALRGRCRSQLAESHASTSLNMLHSVYLSWLLESDDNGNWRASKELQKRYASPHRCRIESTVNRIEQSAELLEHLRHTQSPAASTTTGRGSSSLVVQLADWYHGGCNGLSVARESRRRNPIYELERTAAIL